MEDFKYKHIFSLLEQTFKFDIDLYGNYIKDIIKVLIESEKNGETFVDIDNVSYSLEISENGWPEKHINALKNSGLISSDNSPIIFNDRKLSFVKWSKKIDEILKLLLNKSNENITSQKDFNLIKNFNNVSKIKSLFKLTDLVFLQGGPGTGKSTLIVELILYYLNNYDFINIGISAPTGKATSRLKETLDKKSKSKTKSDLNNVECQTLHRWIYNSSNNNGRLKYNLKELDLFIIDEMSMVNINLIETILNLLAKDCKLLLVGDANQLPPINNCSIWNYIFTNANSNIFNSSTINLDKVYRNNGDINELSKIIFSTENKNFYTRTKQIIKNKTSSNLRIFEAQNKLIPEELINKINLHIMNLKKLVILLSKKEYIFTNEKSNFYDPEKDLIINIFKRLNSQLVLCKTNTGIWGVEEINKIIINQNDHYDFSKIDEGIPIMCTENNNELGISNGDIGVIIGKKSSRRFLFRRFNEHNNQTATLIEPDKLENIIPAIAITIHKSQGSESDYVNVLWNQNNISKDINNNCRGIIFRDNFERRLFYTAITRARKNLDIYYLNN
tara:strand:+ start:984 stop:2663 length:1680 start_codon:yes stop_codon:yes gene_type:complete